MPRPPAVTPDQIESVLQKISPFQNNGEIMKKSDKIWKQASTRLCKVISNATLYFYIKKDWNGITTRLKKYWNVPEVPFNDKQKKDLPKELKQIQTGKMENDQTDSDIRKPIDDCPEKTFSFFYADYEWKDVEPIINEKDPSRYRLPDNWTYSFLNKIKSTAKMSCSFIFKKSWFSKRDNSIKVKGHCKLCGNKIEAICESMITRRFDVTTKDSSYIIHSKKKRVSKNPTGEKEEIVIKTKNFCKNEPSFEDPVQVIENEVDNSEVKRPPVYITSVQRLRQEALFKKLAITSSTKDVIFFYK